MHSVLGTQDRNEREDDELEHTFKVTLDIELCFVLICTMVSLLFTIAVLAKTISRGTFKRLPLKIRITLVLNLLQMFATFVLTIYILLKDLDELEDVTEQWYTRLSYASAGLLWIAINWQFTSYYMQTACLLKSTLRARSNADISLV